MNPITSMGAIHILEEILQNHLSAVIALDFEVQNPDYYR